ncbi:hypothetical protein [Candidatus Odyssella acanthamoebae]|nr:hypothetical protein [Candidatus Paracaedibacter acanthamoebae]
MKILTVLLILKTVSATESEIAPGASSSIILTQSNLQLFLTETSTVTFGQILFRADDVFSGDTAYNKLFRIIAEDAASTSPSESPEFYSKNIIKLHHILAKYIVLADSHTKKLIDTIVSKSDTPDKLAIGLEKTYETIHNIYTYLVKWGPTIIGLYDHQLRKAQALGYSNPRMLPFFNQFEIDDVLANLTKYLAVLDIQIKENQKRQKNKENQPAAPPISKVKIPRLNLRNSGGREISPRESKIKSPRQVTPRKLIKSLSGRLFKNSQKDDAESTCPPVSPPYSWDRNTILRAKNSDECRKRF